MSQELLLFIAGQAFTGIGVYAAIRSDLRECLVRLANVERRLDRIELHS